MATAFNRLPFGKRHAIYVAQLKKQATPAELRFLAHLAALGLPYRFQQGFFEPYHRIVDFFLPDHNLIVEIDGLCHDADADRERDAWFSRERGIKIIRFTNEQVLSGDFKLPCVIGVS